MFFRFSAASLMLACLLRSASGNPQVTVWLTDPEKSILFQPQPATLPFNAVPDPVRGTQTGQKPVGGNPVIEVNESRTYQTIDGFGCCLTGGSARHIIQMDAADRKALLKELFSCEGTNIGISYLRVSIGSSDLNDHAFSYDDMPPGRIDPEMKQFTLQPDRADVIPVLKEILAINPNLKILGSPWSSPAWMKDNRDTRGGRLLPEFYGAYARYFVAYIRDMKAEGIPIDAITVQNEPLNPNNNPSLLMLASEEASFIKDHLGPAFKAKGIGTKIILYDHNCDHPEYPISILDDPEAGKYVDGSAFHWYAGQIEALSSVHQAHPDKNVYFTEQWTGASDTIRQVLGTHIRNLIIGATRNWSRNVLEWNLAADSRYEPHTDRGGCDQCQGAITIDGNKVLRNPAYYILAHASKFVRPGSVRVDSNSSGTLPNVAFKTPDGKNVLIVMNSSTTPKTFNIRCDGKQATSTLSGGVVATCIW